MYPPWHSWPRGSPHRPTRMAGLTQGGASSPSTLSRARPLRSVAASPVSSVWLFSVACALHSRLQPLGDYRLSRRCSLPRGYQTGVQLLVRGSAGDVAGTGTPLSSVPPTPPSPPLPRRTGRLPLRTLLPGHAASVAVIPSLGLVLYAAGVILPVPWGCYFNCPPGPGDVLPTSFAIAGVLAMLSLPVWIHLGILHLLDNSHGFT